MSAEQLEAWPELRQNERVNRAVRLAQERADYLLKQSWPSVSAANRAQLLYIVTSALATYDHDIRARE